jgi:hypothetical protein
MLKKSAWARLGHDYPPFAVDGQYRLAPALPRAHRSCAPMIATGQPCTNSGACVSGKCDINLTNKCIDSCLAE